MPEEPTRLRRKANWFGVVLDCRNARELATFYAQLLDWQVFGDGDNWVNVAPSLDAGYNLAFASEPQYQAPAWPSRAEQQQMQMHLDFEVDDLDSAVAHALECGATEAEFQAQANVRVMLDPAGHPFCLYVDQS